MIFHIHLYRYFLDDNSRVHLIQPNSNQQKNFNDYINATLIGVILRFLSIKIDYIFSCF